MFRKHILQILNQAAACQQPVHSSVRLYSRWMHRKPAKVVLSFEHTPKTSLKKEKVISLDPEILNKSQQKQDTVKVLQSNEVPAKKLSPDKSKEIKEKRDETIKKRNFYLNQKKVFDDDNEFIYEKLKENDSRLSPLLVKLKNKKERMRTGQVLVEGWRLIVDGLEAKCPLKYIIFSRLEDLNNLRPFMPNTGVKIFKIPYKEIELWSDVETPSGIFGVFETPKPENVRILSRPLPLHLICDNVRVPGNLGAILRAAVGAGCEKVLLTKGCVDLWDPKVIRSASGAHFRLPIYHSINWEEIPKYLEKNTSIFIADSNAKIHEDAEDRLEDKYDAEQMPVLPYYGVEFASLNHITVIIGGETEGISEDSYRLAAKRNNGLRLNIPMQRGVDSLNTGMAAAVIAFEIRKQLMHRRTNDKLERSM